MEANFLCWAPDNTHSQLAKVYHPYILDLSRFIIRPLVDTDGLYIFMYPATGKNLWDVLFPSLLEKRETTDSNKNESLCES